MRRRHCRAKEENRGMRETPPVAATQPFAAPPSDDGATQAGGHAAQVDRAPFGEERPHEHGAYQRSHALPPPRPASETPEQGFRAWFAPHPVAPRVTPPTGAGRLSRAG
ncbi:hypothetical protein Misp04_32480 [Micromonospora sp. NBRC 101691]|nr:hypothetical protein Misp04_32480 [Micromonospora sp. NBRC 101691]